MHDTTVITFRVKRAQRAQLEAMAKVRGTSLSGVVGTAIDQMLGDDKSRSDREIQRRRPKTVRVTYRGRVFGDAPRDMGESADRTRDDLQAKGYVPYVP